MEFGTIGSVARRRVWLIAGLAAYWPLFRNPYTIALFSNPHLSEASGFLDLSLGYSCLLVCWALIIAAMSRTGRGGKLPRCAPLAFGLAIVLGNIAVTGGFSGSLWSPYAVVAGTAATSFGFAALTVWVLKLLGQLGRNEAVVVALLSFVASHLFVLLDVLQGALAFLPTVVPPLLAGAFLLLSPLPSQGESDGRSQKDASATTGGWAGEGGERSSGADGAAVRPWVALTCFAAEFEVLCIIRALWTFDRHGYSTGPLAMATYAISAAAGCCLLVAFLRRKPGKSISLLCILFVSLLSMVGFCLHFFAEFGTCVISVARTISQLLLLVYLADGAWQEKEPRADAAAVAFFAIDLAGAVLSHFLSGFLADSPGANVADLVAPLSLVCMLVVSLVGICVLVVQLVEQTRASEKMAERYAHEAVDHQRQARGRSDLAIEKFGERYGLTNRERAVVALVARGRSVKIISKTLCVSQSTVQAHMKSVYRKLSIHSKQSLLDLLDETKDLPL